MKNLRFIFLAILAALFLGERAYGQSCACSGDDLIIDVSDPTDASGTYTPDEDTNVCLTGSGTFTGELIMEGTYTICIDDNVTYEYFGHDDMWEGTWTVNNYGTFQNDKEMTIGTGQTFNNYGYFEVIVLAAGADNELLIQAGGTFYNDASAEMFVSGDIINHGNLDSMGDIVLENEFKNFSTAIINNLTGTGDITNEGTIELYGVIESVEGSFYNQSGASVLGKGDPCSWIKAANEIENHGTLDGSESSLIVDSGEGEEGYQNTGTEIPGVENYHNPDAVISEECLKVLPVLWDVFSVGYNEGDKSVGLVWATSKEWETSHFVIERSVDGVDGYMAVGKVDAVGWSDLITEYGYIDESLPLTAKRLYYRLKQVDLSGSYAYSKTLMVELPSINVSRGVWKVFPNPLNEQPLQVALLEPDKYKGEVIYFRVFNAISSTGYATAKSLEQLNALMPGEMVNFSSGLVVLEIRWGAYAEYMKVIN